MTTSSAQRDTQTTTRTARRRALE
ncbi:thiamine phosphate synthase, partial [Geobacillus sp. MMMUD3]|nr:thiamine phosphate synthase [Geobacillus sp. MMMUD3]